jgi:hypothetical protein
MTRISDEDYKIIDQFYYAFGLRSSKYPDWHNLLNIKWEWDAMNERMIYRYKDHEVVPTTNFHSIIDPFFDEDMKLKMLKALIEHL